MDELIDDRYRLSYHELPIHSSAPVKLDKILAARLEAFMKSRKVKPHGRNIADNTVRQ